MLVSVVLDITSPVVVFGYESNFNGNLGSPVCDRLETLFLEKNTSVLYLSC